jgi:hypothetical protein
LFSILILCLVYFIKANFIAFAVSNRDVVKTIMTEKTTVAEWGVISVLTVIENWSHSLRTRIKAVICVPSAPLNTGFPNNLLKGQATLRSQRVLTQTWIRPNLL